ncbi:fanconi-associated nuclease 1-like isoform X1 [Vanessa tameamea]|uniref:Fanconi-associated nuclease n=2 Tax=Vanessa tameamea TaxID=334116 RepID=A0A8B8IGQ7_VANTA
MVYNKLKNMNQQTTLNKYFKIKTNSFKEMDINRKKKCNLSITKTPIKLPKLTLENEHVVDLISDDDDEGSISSKTCELNQSQTSSSESTLIYTPEMLHKSPVNQSPFEEISNKSSMSPSSDHKSLNKSSPSFRSPSTSHKYFSPTKKRSIKVRTPTKAKRNLSDIISKCDKQNIFNNEEFLQASKNLDDLTIFLLKIIYQFLCDDNLKPLLEESSCSLLSRAMKVKKPGMRLVCRLYWQQEGWRRWDKVKKIMIGKFKVDDPTLHEAVNSLIESGFITVANSNNGEEICFDKLLKMLKQDELKLICKEFKIKTTKKDDAVQSLKNFCYQKTNITNYFVGSKSTNETRVLNLLRSKVGPCYKLSDEARNTLKELYILMYLGMDYSIIKEKRLELMLLNDKTKRETFPIDKDMEIDNASLVFKNREQFLSYVNAGVLYEDIEEATDLSEKCEKIKRVYDLYNEMGKEELMSYIKLPVWLRRYTPAYIYVKILEAGIQELKKSKVEKNILLAVDILSKLLKQTAFREHKRAEWYSEKALILDKLLLLPEKAAEVLLEGFNSNLPEKYLDFIRPRAKLLAKRQTNPISSALKVQLLSRADKYDILEKNIKAVHIYKQPMYNGGRGKIKFETRTADGMLVQEAEEYCKYHYIQEGKYTHGGHWEGKIVTTIFFLLFWDIIYAQLEGIRGIFLSHYQTYPLDMFCEDFYNNRKALIEKRLKEIEESTTEEILTKIETAWESRPETEQSGVQSGAGGEAARAACARLAPARVARVCARLAADFAHAHSGFPDLTLWNERTGEIAFVEVKTDSDKPSMKQIQWMHYMQQHGIDTEFCYVGVHTGRARSRNTQELEEH